MFYLLSKINPVTTKGVIFFKLNRLYNDLANNKSAHLIRKEFLDYFAKSLNHSIIRSSPISPITDQSLAFTNAGMNQVHLSITTNSPVLVNLRNFFLKLM